ncbi:MAG: secretin N-terminal domain-containing protein, partial [bacterium]
NLQNLRENIQFIISKEGTVVVNENTKTIIVKDTPENMVKVTKFINRFDVQDDQVGSKIQENGVRIFPIKYSDANSLKSIIEPFASSNGKISVDIETNSILVEDSINNIMSIEKAISNIDKPATQVLVEAAIIKVTLNDETRLGINWSWLEETSGGALTTFNAANKIISSPQEGIWMGEGAGQRETSLRLGISKSKINALLDVLQTRTNFDVLAHPKVLGINHKEASIMVGEKLGYKVVKVSDGVTAEEVNFLEVGTKLKFTPHITEDKSITMEIKPEISEGSVTGGIPNTSTTETSATIRVKDGQTIILGGLIKEKTTEVVNKVPGLGSIPILGILFRHRGLQASADEVIIFITPHILNDEKIEAFKDDIKRIKNQYEKNKKEYRAVIY